MAVFTIPKGKHYPRRPPLGTLPWVGARDMHRVVTFGESARYDAAAYNRDDVNKLFGLSFGFGGVHGNSARFGWRWSRRLQAIELLAYCYLDGQRNWDGQMRFPVVATIRPGQVVNCRLGLHRNGFYYFTVRDANEEVLGMHLTAPAPAGLPCFGLTHGPYFGGSLTAPHTCTVRLDRP